MAGGMRSRIHHLTRNRVFLIKTALGILAAGFSIALLIVWLSAEERKTAFSVHVDPFEQLIREGYHRLLHGPEKQPRELSRWLQRVISRHEHLSDATESPPMSVAAFVESGKLAVYDVRKIIARHAGGTPQEQMLADAVIAALDPRDARGSEAMERMRHAAARRPAIPLANELLGFLLMRQEEKEAALAAWVVEGEFEDADAIREKALRLALQLRDQALLASLMQRPLWRDSASPLLLHRIGGLIGDLWLQWTGLFGHQLMNARIGTLLFALLAGSLWYVILVQRSRDTRWRWAWPLVPVIAGVCSVWPTLAILAYQTDHLGMSEDAPFPWDAWHWLGGVGLREELCKLVLFSVLLPWLLWRRDAGLALLAAAFTGLGFALEENVSNYYGEGGGVVWTRFLTANFFHAALTGIAGLALFELLQSRFARPERFFTAFLGVVAAHGFYDYSLSANFSFDQGSFDFISIVILALAATWFFDALAEHTRESPGAVSPAAIFLLGSALLVAVMFIAAALSGQGMSGIADVGKECAGVAPVMWIYWRKFPVGR